MFSSDNLNANKQNCSQDGEISGYRWHGSKQLRRGYTTGTCAAAAGRAAALVLLGQCPERVLVKLPEGVLSLKVEGFELLDGFARAWVIKDAGDDPDITHGARIEALVRFLSEEKIVVNGGEGVGVVTKAGLAVSPGQPAINPVPMAMIKENVGAVLPPGRGAEVMISVPDGKRLAKRTMNPQLGIIGGISILGTTGIVEPMSEEAFKQALIPQLQIARSAGLETLLLTPGRRGVRMAQELLDLPPEAVIMTSNFIGFIMEECQRLGFGQVILWGHAGKLAKVAAGVFQTHNRVADGRAEVIAALAGALGASPSLIKQLLEVPTVEGMVKILKEAGLEQLWMYLAERASRRAVRYARGDLQVGTVMFSYDRTLLGYDQTAVDLLKARGWLTAECELAAKIKGESPG